MIALVIIIIFNQISKSQNESAGIFSYSLIEVIVKFPKFSKNSFCDKWYFFFLLKKSSSLYLVIVKGNNLYKLFDFINSLCSELYNGQNESRFQNWKKKKKNHSMKRVFSSKDTITNRLIVSLLKSARFVKSANIL